jgi:hypothetical protein
MSTDVPSSGGSSRPLKVTAHLAPGRVAASDADPSSAAVRVPVAQVPLSELLDEPMQGGATPSVSTSSDVQPSASKKEVAALVDALAALSIAAWDGAIFAV